MKHTLLGQTLDDAAGEVIDKVGRELGLGYPAGPVVEVMASEGDRNAYQLPLAMKNTVKSNLDFSFSGLKTKAIQMLHGRHDVGIYTERNELELSKQEICNFAASFQQAVIDSVIFKVKRAVINTQIKTLTVTGGVSANNELRKQLRMTMKNLGGTLLTSDKKFTGDNAAMIAKAAEWAAARGEIAETKDEIEAVDRQPNMNFQQKTLS